MTHVCVNKDGVTKYIHPDKLDEFLSNGWVQGTTSTSTLNHVCI